jgi:hypothetical protein
VPETRPARYTERLEVQVSPGQFDTVRRHADLLGVSQSAVVRALIEQLKTDPNSLEVARNAK